MTTPTTHRPLTLAEAHRLVGGWPARDCNTALAAAQLQQQAQQEYQQQTDDSDTRQP